MNNSSVRQKYLSLVARLYELAAEFTDSELRDIRENLLGRDERGVAKAVEGLMLLHGVSRIRENDDVPPTAPTIVHRKSARKAGGGESIQDKSLEELLGDKDIFPTIHDLVRVVPGKLEPRLKENRSRYIKRVVHHVASLDEASRNRFRKVLADELSQKSPSFVSQWKSLIREL